MSLHLFPREVFSLANVEGRPLGVNGLIKQLPVVKPYSIELNLVLIW